MPRLERWIVASKMVEVLDAGSIKTILDLGGHIGGGWCQVHQHIAVNVENKEKIEEVLRNGGYVVSETGDKTLRHPEMNQ